MEQSDCELNNRRIENRVGGHPNELKEGRRTSFSGNEQFEMLRDLIAFRRGMRILASCGEIIDRKERTRRLLLLLLPTLLLLVILLFSRGRNDK